MNLEHIKYSWLEPFEDIPDPFEVMVWGYVRGVLVLVGLDDIEFPEDCVKVIATFCLRKCKLFAVGANNYSEFGVKGKLSSFTQLTEFDRFSFQPHDLYTGYQRYTLANYQDRIFSIGNNYNGESGVYGADCKQLLQLTEIDMGNVERFDAEDGRTNFVSCISRGTSHTLFVLNDVLYSMGQNEYGQCGVMYDEEARANDASLTARNILRPHLISRAFRSGDGSNILKIECGYNHTLVLCANGHVFACGRNEDFQCGRSDTQALPSLTLVECGVPFTDICVGSYHNMCVSREQQLFVFGRNLKQECGVYATIDTTGVFVREDHYETPTIHPYFVMRNKRIKFMTTKHEHSMVLDTDGLCYLFGSNSQYQICSKRVVEDVVVFQQQYYEYKKLRFQSGSCGYNHTLLLSQRNHDVFGFGGNEHKQTFPYSTKKETRDPHMFVGMEIGIKYEEQIVRCIAGEFTTILIQQD